MSGARSLILYTQDAWLVLPSHGGASLLSFLSPPLPPPLSMRFPPPPDSWGPLPLPPLRYGGFGLGIGPRCGFLMFFALSYMVIVLSSFELLAMTLTRSDLAGRCEGGFHIVYGICPFFLYLLAVATT